jgi:hypothetical protein
LRWLGGAPKGECPGSSNVRDELFQALGTGVQENENLYLQLLVGELGGQPQDTLAAVV